MSRICRFAPLAMIALLLVGGLQAQESREVRKSGPFAKDGRLLIDTYKGSVEVTTWEKPEIDIVARIESEGSGRNAKENVERTEVRIKLTENSARVKTDYDKVRRHLDGFFGIFDGESVELPMVHYVIRVPKSARVEIKDYKSKTRASGLQSRLTIDSYKGEIDIQNLSGSLDLNTYKGEARVNFANLTGKSTAETYKGEIEITLPKEKGFDLDAEIGKGADFRSDFALGQERTGKRSRSRDIRTAVNGGCPLVRLDTHKGTIRLLEQ